MCTIQYQYYQFTSTSLKINHLYRGSVLDFNKVAFQFHLGYFEEIQPVVKTKDNVDEDRKFYREYHENEVS